MNKSKMAMGAYMCGSRSKSWGYSGFSRCFHYPSCHFGTSFEPQPSTNHFSGGSNHENQGCGIKGFIPTSVQKGNLSLCVEALSVVSQKWYFPQP